MREAPEKVVFTTSVFWSASFKIHCRDHLICFIKLFRSKCIIFVCNVNVALYFAAIMKKVMVTTLIRQLYYNCHFLANVIARVKKYCMIDFQMLIFMFIYRNSKRVAPFISHELSNYINTRITVMALSTTTSI